MRVNPGMRARLAEIFREYQEEQAREMERRLSLAERPKGPLVVEIPLRRNEEQRGAGEEEAQRCVRLRSDGSQCPFPVLEGYDECLRHARWYQIVPALPGLPYPEDALSLQEMMARAVSQVMCKRLTAGEARAIALLGQVMLRNLRRCERELESQEQRG